MRDIIVILLLSFIASGCAPVKGQGSPDDATNAVPVQSNGAPTYQMGAPKTNAGNMVQGQSGGSNTVNNYNQIVVPQTEKQLLERAAHAAGSCHVFQENRAEQAEWYRKAYERSGFSEQERKQMLDEDYLMHWKVDSETYAQDYGHEFMEVHKALVLKGMKRKLGPLNFEHPFNGGEVTGICADLTDLTEQYISHLYSNRTINSANRQRYREMIWPQPEASDPN